MKTIAINFRFLLPFFFMLAFQNLNAQVDTLSTDGMNNKKMDGIFKAVSSEMEGVPGS